jgi:tripartite-type tricarboxylate transporter receptor subunit TctC
MKKAALIFIVLLSTVILANNSFSGDASLFYQGKVVSWSVPYNPGGGYDTYSRLLAPFFEKLTGTTVVVRNSPGAGGLVGANKLYTAKSNGLTLGIVNAMGLLSATIREKKGLRFDIKKFSWLGRVVSDAQVLTLRKDFPVDDAKGLLKLKKPLRVGAGGKGSGNYLVAMVLKNVTGMPMEIILGYDTTAEIDLSIARGELDAVCGSYGPRLAVLKSGEQKMGLLVTGAKPPEYPNVVSVEELISSENSRIILSSFNALLETGRAMAGPPGISNDRLDFLRNIFKKAINDPDVIKQFKKRGLPLGYANHEQQAMFINKALDAPPTFKKLIRGQM